MADHIRIYAAYLWELCTAPVLPFEFVGVAGEFKGRIGELALVLFQRRALVTGGEYCGGNPQAGRSHVASGGDDAAKRDR